MRYLVLGAGAIGGYFGGRLIEGGSDVTFLVREKRKAQLEAQGIRIESPFGAAELRANAVTAAEAAGKPWDVILLSCKAYDLASAIETIKGSIGPQSVVLPLLNGLAHIETLNSIFGKDRVLGGLAKIAATLRSDGVIEHLNDWRSITFGEQEAVTSPRVTQIKASFDNTSVLAKSVPNIMHMMWEKVVHLSTVAGMTTLMRGSVGEIAAAGGSGLLSELLARNAELAKLEGYPMSSEFFVEFNKLFNDATSNYKASMLRDMERNGQIEADHIIGFMLDTARRRGLETTMHQIIYTNLKVYEAQRRGALH